MDGVVDPIISPHPLDGKDDGLGLLRAGDLRQRVVDLLARRKPRLRPPRQNLSRFVGRKILGCVRLLLAGHARRVPPWSASHGRRARLYRDWPFATQGGGMRNRAREAARARPTPTAPPGTRG